MLRSAELQVLTAADPAEAERLMLEESPQIVLLDIRIGGASGLDLFAVLRRCNPRVLVIFITGHGSAETAIETMKLGAFDYLLKPLSPSQVRDALVNAQAVFAAPKQHDASTAKRHISTAVIGTRGGCGASTLATSLAWLPYRGPGVPVPAEDDDPGLR